MAECRGESSRPEHGVLEEHVGDSSGSSRARQISLGCCVGARGYSYSTQRARWVSGRCDTGAGAPERCDPTAKRPRLVGDEGVARASCASRGGPTCR